MPFVLDATPGGPNSNSYITRAELEEFAESHPDGNLIESLSDDDKDRYASSASLRIDAEKFTALPTNREPPQRLQFPRNFAFDRSYTSYDKDEIPLNLKRAVFELILFRLKSDDRIMDEVELHDAAMLDTYSVGPLNYKFKHKAKMDVLPETVKRELRAIGPNVWIGESAPKRIIL